MELMKANMYAKNRHFYLDRETASALNISFYRKYELKDDKSETCIKPYNINSFQQVGVIDPFVKKKASNICIYQNIHD